MGLGSGELIRVSRVMIVFSDRLAVDVSEADFDSLQLGLEGRSRAPHLTSHGLLLPPSLQCCLILDSHLFSHSRYNLYHNTAIRHRFLYHL